MKMIGIKTLLPIKDFLNTLILKHLISMTTKMLGTILFVSSQILIYGFSTGVKNYKKVFQTGFRNCGYLWVSPQIFFVLKLAKLLNTSKPIVIAFSLLETVIHFSFVINLESLGFYVGTLVTTIFSRKPIP